VVQSGDNLSKIAENFGVTANCLQRSNGIVNPDVIFSGQRLLISGSCQAGGGGDQGVFSANRQCFGDRNPGRLVSGGAYTVQQGDTLDFIGCDLNMNTTCLVAVNNLDQKGGRIAIGQRLTISGQCAGWVAP
jgi:LysM repeat protein